jgi:hypothetical protein
MGRISKKLSEMIRSSRKRKVIRLRDYAKEKQLLDDSKNDVILQPGLFLIFNLAEIMKQ